MSQSHLFRLLKQRRYWLLNPRNTILPSLIVGASTMISAQVATIPAGVPLRVEIDHRYPMKVGTQLEGHLIAPVYLVDHQVLPVNTRISGTIIATHSVSKGIRTDALLNGDFTPLATPEVRFDHLTLPNGDGAEITTDAVQRDASVVRMRSTGKPFSIKDQVTEQVKQRKQDALDTITKPGKSDRLRRFLYTQLPYHPQVIWAGTQYDAELTQPLPIPQRNAPAPLPLQQMGDRMPTGTLEARLTHPLDSASARDGASVNAVLTKPLLDPTQQEVILPEGTHLIGSVLQAKPARWFARNGKLRFTFRQIELQPGLPAQAAPAQPSNEIEPQSQLATQASPHEESTPHLLSRPIHGQMTAAEAAPGQDVSVDAEGGAKAGSGKNKYLAPLALGLLAASSMDGDEASDVFKNGVVSNGFGLIARIVTMAASNRGLAQGFAYFAV
ncbi:MAG: hypothetical protein QOE55_920, partial [Acidobacteriaceae bacterium]|nr:hypothetical protein [Acidobacteriaceae bacterium]